MSNKMPQWLQEAMRLEGVHEIKGAAHNPEIVQMWKDIKRSGIKDDETPWCAAFVGACLERAGIQSSRFESAKSYLGWGIALQNPVYGCVVVMDRKGGGHVGFLVGIDKAGNLQILGGNQEDQVKVSSFSKDRVTAGGYRWPSGVNIDAGELLACEKGAAVSTKEV